MTSNTLNISVLILLLIFVPYVLGQDDVHSYVKSNQIEKAYQLLNLIPSTDYSANDFQLRGLILWNLYSYDSLGFALLNSEKAYRMSPTEDRSKQLQWLHSKVKENVNDIDGFLLFQVIHNLIIRTPVLFYTIMLFVVTFVYVSTWIKVRILASLFKSSKVKLKLQVLSIVSAIIILFATGWRYNWSKSPIGYTIQSAVTLFSKPSFSEKEVTTLSTGVKVTKLSEFGNWVEVKLPDGRKGWIQSKVVTF